jgi:hypothetical protein
MLITSNIHYPIFLAWHHTSGGPHMFITWGWSLYVPRICLSIPRQIHRNVPRIHLTVPQRFPESTWPFPECTLNVPWILPECSPNAPASGPWLRPGPRPPPPPTSCEFPWDTPTFGTAFWLLCPLLMSSRTTPLPLLFFGFSTPRARSWIHSPSEKFTVLVRNS